MAHVWELTNIGKVIWARRKLVYKHIPKDWHEAYSYAIDTSDVKQNERIKTTTSFYGHDFDWVTYCKWEMHDADRENCFWKEIHYFV